MGRIIAIVNQKGGSGKTTLTMQLAGGLARRTYRVLVVDADPQATATRWAASAPEDKPFPAAVSGLSAAGGKVHREIAKYVEGFDYILVDCPPALDSPIPQSALLVADLALVPLLPSPPDLWASAGITKLIEAARTVNTSLRALLVINQFQSQKVLSRDTADILQEFGIPVASGSLGSREAYRQSCLYGGTVHDLGARANTAILEVDALTDEVLKLLSRHEPVI